MAHGPLVFLFLQESICYEYSLEGPEGASNEYPQHMFHGKTKKNKKKTSSQFCLKKAIHLSNG